MAVRAAVNHTLLAEARAARRRLGVPALIVRWVQHRVEHLKPAFDGLIAANRRYQEVSRAGRRDIGHPDRLGLIAPQLFVGSLQKLDRRRAAERFHPEIDSVRQRGRDEHGQVGLHGALILPELVQPGRLPALRVLGFQTISPQERMPASRTSCTRSVPRAPFETGEANRRSNSAWTSISSTSP
jgi:hypothetical protein